MNKVPAMYFGIWLNKFNLQLEFDNIQTINNIYMFKCIDTRKR